MGLIPARAGRTTGDCEDLPINRGGSSPLVRGGQGTSGKLNYRSVRGLIPARAGRTTTQPAAQARGVTPAHPRSCGADSRAGILETIVPPGGGSSPLVRGGWQDVGPFFNGVGVGSSPLVQGADLIPVVSPVGGVGGSSPLVRGGHRSPPNGRSDGSGLIPARAGRTCPYGVHQGPWPGSSPARAGRTLQSGPRGTGVPVRLIPARAGRTRVHARTPRRNPTRLIPARAGRTILACITLAKCAAHPARGDELLLLRPSAGSSPLVRGGLWKALGCPRAQPPRAGRTG